METLPILASVAQSPNARPAEEVVRRTANFHPSIWGDQFINYDHSQHIMTLTMREKEVDELKETVRREVFQSKAAGDCSHQLKLIDAIQRLGLDYHFEKEIEEALQRVHATFQDDHASDDLYNVALGFRLLRQHGFNVSSDVFNKFKDENCSGFKETLMGDIGGILSLYEASHLRVHGEDILEEALHFTTTHLESAATHDVGNPLAPQITQALERPLRKSLERLGAARYIPIYQDEASRNEDLLKLAKMDFDLVQHLHKKELQEITKWWRALDFERKLPFARDRMVEVYFWMVGVCFEPQFSVGRAIMTKVSMFIITLDDIYDAFGTFEELVVFTEAIDRWDLNCMEELPADYMQIFYGALLNLFNEIEEEMVKEGRSYRVPYAIQAMKNLARSYFNEARWLHEGRIPSMEEYMSVATVSIGYTILTTISLLVMGDLVTKDAFEWVSKDPKIVRAANTIFRLMDDIVSKFEKERGHAPSSVDCYMNQYGVSEEDAVDVFKKQIMDLWKDINEEFLRPTAVPMGVLKRVLNLTRVSDLLYKGEDGFTCVGKATRDSVALVFIEPLLL